MWIEFRTKGMTSVVGCRKPHVTQPGESMRVRGSVAAPPPLPPSARLQRAIALAVVSRDL